MEDVTAVETKGHYYIYLYDMNKKRFMPYRTRIDKFINKGSDLSFKHRRIWVNDIARSTSKKI